jgi:Methyltransferase domain
MTGAKSVVDVGCATGAWLSVVREHGIDDFLGIDGAYIDPATLVIPRDRFLAHDLEKPIGLDRRFDLALSLETAEHLSPLAAPSFVASLAGLAPVVLFSAAIPKQGGVHHVNEQWPEYWADLFAEHGYRPLDVIRTAVWNERDVAYPYAQNTFLYVHHAVDLVITPSSVPMPTRVVHPEMYLDKVADMEHLWQQLRIRQLPRTVARALREALARRARDLTGRRSPH